MHRTTRPECPLTSFAYLNIVPAHLPLAHAAVLGKRPVLEPVAALPLHAVVGVLVLVPELDRNLVAGKGEELLAEPVALFLFPLPGQESFDILGACEKGRAVAPDAVWRVCLGNGFGVPILSIGVFESGGLPHCVFQRSWAFLTLAWAVSAEKGGAGDMFDCRVDAWGRWAE